MYTLLVSYRMLFKYIVPDFAVRYILNRIGFHCVVNFQTCTSFIYKFLFDFKNWFHFVLKNQNAFFLYVFRNYVPDIFEKKIRQIQTYFRRCILRLKNNFAFLKCVWNVIKVSLKMLMFSWKCVCLFIKIYQSQKPQGLSYPFLIACH